MRWPLLLVAFVLPLAAVADARAQAPDREGLEDAMPSEGSPRDASSVVFPGNYRLTDLATSERVEIGGGRTLSLGRVLSSVERHHPSIESTRQGVRAAEGEQLAAEGGFDLTLSARGWASPQGYYDWGRADVLLEQPTPLWGASFYTGWRIGRGGDIPDYYGQYETLEGGELRAGVRVPLWRDGPIDSRRTRLWRAQHGSEAARAGLDARLLGMQLAATRAYYSWVAAGLRYRVAADLLDLAEQRDSQIAARVGAGAIPPIESLENRRVIVSRRTSLVSARRALEQAAIALSLYHRHDDGRPSVPRASQVPTELEVPAPLRVQLPRAVQAAFQTRPEMRQYDSLIARQRVSVDYAENQFSPRIDLGVGASVDLGSGNSASEQERLGTPVVEGSVLISLPLQFREARGGIQRSRAELGALQADAQLTRERIATEVQDAWSAVRAAEEQLSLAREAAEIASAVAEAERRRFELGATQLFIVNLREQAAAAARAVLVNAEAGLQVARAAWRAATAQGPSDPSSE